MIKKVAVMGLGMGVGPLVQLMATPWLSRIYSPTEFGYYALFVSSVSALANVACLRYETAIPVVEGDLLKPTTRLALLSALVILLLALLVLWSGFLQYLYPLFTGLGGKVLWIPVVAACSGTMLLSYYLTLRRGEFILNAVLRSLQPIIFVILAIFFSGHGLLSAQIVSWLVVVFVGLFYLSKDIYPLQKKVLWAAAVRLRHYPILLAPTSILDAVALTLPLFLIGSVYGIEATGNYAQIQRIIGAPLLLGSAVLGQMFFKYSGELYRSRKSSSQLLWWTVSVLAGVALLLLVALVMVGETIGKWMLGGSWRVDTFFLVLVTIPFICRAIVSPISTVFLTHHRVSLGVRWQIGYFTTTCAVLYSASRVFDFEYFLLAYGIHEMILYAIYLAMANRVVATSVT